MSSVRVPASQRRAVSRPNQAKPSAPKKESRAATLFTAALLTAASPISIAVAQGTLPPLSVETTEVKKKAKATPTAKAGKAAPVVEAPPAPVPKGANPYANPDAPYNVERSASGKLTEPLANTPRSVTVVPKEVIEDTGAKDLRDLARSVPGLTIGSAEGGNAYGAFAIRGFKANNDIFVDNIRNPGNLVPEVFSVQQIEVYKGPSGGIAGRNTIGGAVNIISKQPDFSSNFFEVTTTVGTDNTFRTTLDANQIVSPGLAVRANVMYDQHDVAGRDFADSERWGGLFSFTARPSDNLKVTLDYYRYRNDATPDWGVPVRNVDNVPVTELGAPRNTWVGMAGLDFFKEDADILTGTVVAKLADGITLTNRSRFGQSRLSYVATSMEGYPDVHHPNRDQIADIYANQTELNFKFTTGAFHHNLVAGVEATRETIDRNAYLVTNNFDPVAAVPAQSIQANRYDRQQGPDLRCDDRHGRSLPDGYRPAFEAVDRKRRGPVRQFERDQVGRKRPGRKSRSKGQHDNVQADLFSWNVGIVYKPIPIASFYVAYATSESPIGSELDSTGAQYNGISAKLVNVPPQEARSVEVGTKWELFDKRLLATAALFQTDVDHARTNDDIATLPIPPRASPASIACGASSSALPATSPRTGACTADLLSSTRRCSSRARSRTSDGDWPTFR